MRTWGWMMVAVSAFLAAVSGLYWLTSYEEAGSTMLVLAAVLAAVAGAYLVAAGGAGAGRGAHERGAPPHAPGGPPGAPAGAYLPESSPWPLALGAGSAVLANGLALGLWAVVPGALVCAAAVIGLAGQSRRRD